MTKIKQKSKIKKDFVDHSPLSLPPFYLYSIFSVYTSKWLIKFFPSMKSPYKRLLILPLSDIVICLSTYIFLNVIQYFFFFNEFSYISTKSVFYTSIFSFLFQFFLKYPIFLYKEQNSQKLISSHYRLICFFLIGNLTLAAVITILGSPIYRFFSVFTLSFFLSACGYFNIVFASFSFYFKTSLLKEDRKRKKSTEGAIATGEAESENNSCDEAEMRNQDNRTHGRAAAPPPLFDVRQKKAKGEAGKGKSSEMLTREESTFFLSREKVRNFVEFLFLSEELHAKEKASPPNEESKFTHNSFELRTLKKSCLLNEEGSQEEKAERNNMQSVESKMNYEKKYFQDGRNFLSTCSCEEKEYFLAEENVNALITIIPFSSSCLGCWIGAAALLLDWRSSWFKWPSPCMYGALYGYIFGTFASFLLIQYVFQGK